MLRYVPPVLLFAATIGVLAGWTPLASRDLEDRASVAAALYLAGLVWWVIAAAWPRDGRLGRRMLVLWLPALVPIACVVAAGLVLPYDDTAGLGMALFLAPAIAAGLVCSAGTLIYRLRRDGLGSRRGGV